MGTAILGEGTEGTYYDFLGGTHQHGAVPAIKHFHMVGRYPSIIIYSTSDSIDFHTLALQSIIV